MLSANESNSPVAAALYIRVSTTEQAELGYSIVAQEQALRQYCEATNKVVYEVYCDRGITGTSIEKRFALKRLLNDAKKGLFQEVLVWKVNRMARVNLDLLKIVDELSRHDVGFRSITESHVDTTTKHGVFNLHMMGAFSELDRNTILENAQMGLKQRARTGKHNTRAPLGYQVAILSLSGRKRNTRIEVVPEEAAIVRRIFEQFASGRGLRSIANSLNRDGHRTKKGNAFTICAVGDILDNAFYVGKIIYLKYLDWNKKRRKGKNTNPIIADGQHDPIISEELWDKVRFLRQQKSVVSEKRFHGDLLLTGLLRCPVCGSAMTGSRTNNKDKHGNLITRFYYSCSKMRSSGAVVCKANSIRKQDAEDYLFARLKEVLAKPHILRGIVRGINDRKVNSVRPLQEELAAVCSGIEEINAKKNRLVELCELDDFDRLFVTERIKNLDSDLYQLHARRADIANMLTGDYTEPVSYETVRSLLGRFEHLLRYSNRDQRKTLLHLIISKITLTSDKKVDKIEMIFDEMTEQHFLSAAPSSAIAEEGAFLFERKVPDLTNRLTITI
ncbi:recombinase family protein [Cohnella faecalis]|uniref:Recombinase family protein n=1 Tax=Cohnella faecalis TaxID=2315694 RepID=A0A398CKU7_9BACL|nr:recombinase family protein [Cohnella faecalis]RIE01508.1 recombinase family protein [Cohnella faecalis]